MLPTPAAVATSEHALAVARGRGILAQDETYADGVERASSALAGAEAHIVGGPTDLFDAMGDALLSGRLGLSSQLFTAAGRSTQVAACTVLRLAGADASSLRALVAHAAEASAAGMGCGIDLSEQPNPAATAVALNDALHALHVQARTEGRRPPAFMLTCDAFHPLALDFVHAKSSADFGRWVANISLTFGEDDARWAELLDSVAAAAHRNGEPGVLFRDRAEADNPTPGYRLESTAPCAEVFMAAHERCVFVSVNLAAHVGAGGFDWDDLKASVDLAVRVADAAAELAAVDAPAVVGDRRRVGVGVCGFHSALIALGIPYAAGVPFAEAVSERVLYSAHAASAELALKRGPFPAWANSRWRDPVWVARKADLRTGAVDGADWLALERRVVSHGIRNAVVVAYPPTGIVSELLEVSKSYEPHFELRLRGERLRPEVSLGDDVVGDDGQVVSAGEDHLLACARQLSPETHLAVHTAFSALSDESGSKTVNLPTAATVGDVRNLLVSARRSPLKGLTVFRDGCLSEHRT